MTKKVNCVIAYGGRKGYAPLAKDVAEFCIAELMPRMKTLFIEISLEKVVDENDEECSGYCIQHDSREYYIAIEKSMKKDEVIDMVVHEMIHVWQYATGVLKESCKSDGPKITWKGKDYSDTPYSKQPWERQAYRMQDKLAEDYKEWKKTFHKSYKFKI